MFGKASRRPGPSKERAPTGPQEQPHEDLFQALSISREGKLFAVKSCQQLLFVLGAETPTKQRVLSHYFPDTKHESVHVRIDEQQLRLLVEMTFPLSSDTELAKTTSHFLRRHIDNVIERSDFKHLLAHFKLYSPFPGLIVFQCDHQALLAATFMRFQEHYESPHWQGKRFSREHYLDWYRQQSYSSGPSYYFDWGGFNIPDWSMSSSAAFIKKDATPAEQFVIDICRHLTQPFYVIGAANCPDTLRHEQAHALYYLSKDYRDRIEEILKTHPTPALRKALRSAGYAESSIPDEVQAYLCDAPSSLRASYGIPTHWYSAQRRQIRRAYNRALTAPHSSRALDPNFSA